MGNNVTDMFSSIPFGKISAGLFIGIAIGYFFKKSLKIILIIFGFLIVVLFALKSQDIINVNDVNLLGITDKLILILKNSGNFIKENLSFLESYGASGAIAGFFIGLKIG